MTKPAAAAAGFRMKVKSEMLDRKTQEKGDKL